MATIVVIYGYKEPVRSSEWMALKVCMSWFDDSMGSAQSEDIEVEILDTDNAIQVATKIKDKIVEVMTAKGFSVSGKILIPSFDKV